MKPTELEKIKKILETYIWHNGNSWDYEKATKELLSLIEARERVARTEGYEEGFKDGKVVITGQTGGTTYTSDGRAR